MNGILGAGSYGIAMPKHSPYIRNISVAILKLQETSVLDSLWRKWWEYKSQCPKEKSGAGLFRPVNNVRPQLIKKMRTNCASLTLLTMHNIMSRLSQRRKEKPNSN